MKVILKDDVKNVGNMGDIVKVADGYARNYLVPRGLAVEASTKNVKSVEHEKRIIQEKSKKIKNSAQDFSDRLSKVTLVMKANAGEEGKLFGSVTTMDIAEALKNEGFDIDKKKISLDEPIKTLGDHTVNVKIHPEITTNVTVQVVQK